MQEPEYWIEIGGYYEESCKADRSIIDKIG